MSGRVAPDPPLAEVVQRRLDALLAEIPARRAIGVPSDDAQWSAAGAELDGVADHGGWVSGSAGPGSPDRLGSPVPGASAGSPGRALSDGLAGERAAGVGVPGRWLSNTATGRALSVPGSSAPGSADPGLSRGGSSASGSRGQLGSSRAGSSGDAFWDELDPEWHDPSLPDALPLPAAGSAGDGRVPAGAAEGLGRVSAALAEPARRAWEFARAHLVAVGVVALTGCLWAGYQVVQARSTPVAAAAPVAVSPAPSVPSASPTPVARPAVLVHVLGEVARPGVVRLREGARVEDAIAAAGGLTAQADPGELNLAAVVSDGSQVVIGTLKEPRGEVRTDSAAPGSGTSGSPGADGGAGKVSLNTATEAELDTLPGVGPVTAKRIVAWRDEHGRFTRIEELQEVDGIGPKTFAELAAHVSL
jgi:competence protein ComEA